MKIRVLLSIVEHPGNPKVNSRIPHRIIRYHEVIIAEHSGIEVPVLNIHPYPFDPGLEVNIGIDIIAGLHGVLQIECPGNRHIAITIVCSVVEYLNTWLYGGGIAEQRMGEVKIDMRAAKEKFQKVQDAYDKIKKERGIR